MSIDTLSHDQYFACVLNNKIQQGVPFFLYIKNVNFF